MGLLAMLTGKKDAGEERLAAKRREAGEQRERDKAAYANREDYANAVRMSSAKLQQMKARFDAGEVTQRAVELAENQFTFDAKQLGEVDHDVRCRLFNSCPDEGMKRDYQALSRRIKGGIGKRLAEIDREVQDETDSMRRRMETLASETYGGDAIERAYVEREIRECEDRIARLNAERDELLAERQAGEITLAELGEQIRTM